jgi:hypothetical protein
MGYHVLKGTLRSLISSNEAYIRVAVIARAGTISRDIKGLLYTIFFLVNINPHLIGVKDKK